MCEFNSNDNDVPTYEKQGGWKTERVAESYIEKLVLISAHCIRKVGTTYTSLGDN